MAETKPKAADSLRKPEPKKSLGLKPPTLRSYHDDLIRAEIPLVAESLALTSQTSLTSQGSPTRQSQTIAPERDYSKVPNSIAREVVPAGEFKGKSKQLYDCLYHLTRGAIVPRKAVRISRPQLMKKASIGSRVTFDANVSHLKAIGLLEVKPIAGEHEGSEYTVYLPEERSLPSLTTLTSQTRLTSHAQDQDRLVSLESSQTRQSLSVDSTSTSGEAKTSFKTKDRSDDEPAALTEFFRQLERELTGKNSALSDQWRELGKVLAAELRIAAARTTVSNVPAFLAEHLRRRLWKIDKKQARAEGRELPDESSGSPPPSEAAGCPDCSGTGWWYPQGPEKGVAKCRHRQAD